MTTPPTYVNDRLLGPKPVSAHYTCDNGRWLDEIGRVVDAPLCHYAGRYFDMDGNEYERSKTNPVQYTKAGLAPARHLTCTESLLTNAKPAPSDSPTVKCPRCSGRGHSAMLFTVEDPCSQCQGSGQVPAA